MSGAVGSLLLSYLFVYLAGSLLMRERSMAGRSLYLVGTPALFALLDNALRGDLPRHLVEWKAFQLAPAREAFAHCAEEPASCLVGSLTGYLPNRNELTQGY